MLNLSAYLPLKLRLGQASLVVGAAPKAQPSTSEFYSYLQLIEDLFSTSVDTSATYMASGHIKSNDGNHVFVYSSAQPMTHGGDAAGKTWGSNTGQGSDQCSISLWLGIRAQIFRKHGFVGVEAPYLLGLPAAELPILVTVSG